MTRPRPSELGAEPEPSSGEPPRLARRVVYSVFAVVFLFGLTGFEAWPATSFRLFSLERKATRTVYRAATVDAAGAEWLVEPEALDLGSRWFAWPVADTVGASPRTTQTVCEGIAEAVRRSGREVVAVRLYRSRQRIERSGESWNVTDDREQIAECQVSEP